MSFQLGYFQNLQDFEPIKGLPSLGRLPKSLLPFSSLQTTINTVVDDQDESDNETLLEFSFISAWSNKKKPDVLWSWDQTNNLPASCYLSQATPQIYSIVLKNHYRTSTDTLFTHNFVDLNYGIIFSKGQFTTLEWSAAKKYIDSMTLFTQELEILDDISNDLLNVQGLTKHALSESISGYLQLAKRNIMNINSLSCNLLEFKLKIGHLVKITHQLVHIMLRLKDATTYEILSQLHTQLSIFDYLDDDFSCKLRQVIWSIFIPTLVPFFKFIDAWLLLDAVNVNDFNPFNEFCISNEGSVQVLIVLTKFGHVPPFISQAIAFDVARAGLWIRSLSESKPIHHIRGYLLPRSKFDFTDSYQTEIKNYRLSSDNFFNDSRLDAQINESLRVMELETECLERIEKESQRYNLNSQERLNALYLQREIKEALKKTIDDYLADRKVRLQLLEAARLGNVKKNLQEVLARASEQQLLDEIRKDTMIRKYNDAIEVLEQKENRMEWRYQRLELNELRQAVMMSEWKNDVGEVKLAESSTLVPRGVYAGTVQANNGSFNDNEMIPLREESDVGNLKAFIPPQSHQSDDDKDDVISNGSTTFLSADSFRSDYDDGGDEFISFEQESESIVSFHRKSESILYNESHLSETSSISDFESLDLLKDCQPEDNEAIKETTNAMQNAESKTSVAAKNKTDAIMPSLGTQTSDLDMKWLFEPPLNEAKPIVPSPDVSFINIMKMKIPIDNPLPILIEKSLLRLWKCQTQILHKSSMTILFPCVGPLTSQDIRYHFNLIQSYYFLGNSRFLTQILDGFDVEIGNGDADFISFNGKRVKYTPPSKFAFLSKMKSKCHRIFDHLVSILKAQHVHNATPRDPATMLRTVFLNGLVHSYFNTIQYHINEFKKLMNQVDCNSVDDVVVAHEECISRIEADVLKNEDQVREMMRNDDEGPDFVDRYAKLVFENLDDSIFLAFMDTDGFIGNIISSNKVE